jgi:hypothetical protein
MRKWKEGKVKIPVVDISPKRRTASRDWVVDAVIVATVIILIFAVWLLAG